MTEIRFSVWAPDEATFWASWQAAGIVDADRNQTSEYANGFVISDQTSQRWRPMRKTGNMAIDAFGDLIEEMTTVPGWHANVKVYGDLAAQMTYGLNQTDQDGALLNVFDRTWATHIFALTEQPADPTTGFPAGYRNNTGVTYCDARDIATPTNIII